ncbi:MAG: cyclic nucleotide-binding domain-containing protein [Chloroflexota bacterium]|nr:cyclic nucleotide-binding domain-containing protein [Chloroflexota bacterium]
METLEEVIVEHPFFRGLRAEYVTLIARCAGNVRFAPSQYLFHEGEIADRFFLVRRGLVSLEIFVPGRGPVSIQTVGEQEVIGWSWMVRPYRWRYTARALEQTRAVAFDASCMRRKCDANHDLGYEMMLRFAGIISYRLQATRLQFMDIYSLNG